MKQMRPRSETAQRNRSIHHGYGNQRRFADDAGRRRSASASSQANGPFGLGARRCHACEHKLRRPRASTERCPCSCDERTPVGWWPGRPGCPVGFGSTPRVVARRRNTGSRIRVARRVVRFGASVACRASVSSLNTDDSPRLGRPIAARARCGARTFRQACPRPRAGGQRHVGLDQPCDGARSRIPQGIRGRTPRLAPRRSRSSDAGERSCTMDNSASVRREVTREHDE